MTHIPCMCDGFGAPLKPDHVITKSATTTGTARNVVLAKTIYSNFSQTYASSTNTSGIVLYQYIYNVTTDVGICYLICYFFVDLNRTLYMYEVLFKYMDS